MTNKYFYSEIKCALLAKDNDGKITYKPEPVCVGTVATYECHGGFVTVGGKKRMCVLNGDNKTASWSLPALQCRGL